MELRDRFKGCLAGLAVGDAVGAAVEFKPRGSFAPVTDMAGGGPFGLAPGQWTDDTSMALCLGQSLLECRGFDALDQMSRYMRWMRHGYFSSVAGECVDIGRTVAGALARFERTRDPFSGPTEANTAGNGSLMRLAPVPLYYFPNRGATWHHAAESSRTTHGAAECLEACRLFGDILFRALSGRPKREVLFGTPHGPLACAGIRSIAEGSFASRAESEIVGSGYVVNCLEAALWCFLRADDFDSTILLATNLGDDADTTAAVAGQLAGAFYGVGGIRPSWLAQIVMREEILGMGERLGLA
jgi:ADP-ribosyl-[dinitrogen reductase] hydrolase